MACDVKLAERIKGSCERMLRRAEPDLPILQSKQNWKALSGVVKGACRDALQLAMLELRCNDDVVSAKSYLKRASVTGLTLADIPENSVVASSFDIPIYCCLLAHDLSGAGKLANIAIVQNSTPGSHFDAHAKMLSAFVCDDIELFEKHFQHFDNLERLYWWEKQRIYFDLYRAVLQRDSESCNQLLRNAVDEFKLRATDKDFGEQLGEYGGLEYNQFAIDFMTVGIVILAQSKGLVCNLPNSEYFPAALI